MDYYRQINENCSSLVELVDLFCPENKRVLFDAFEIYFQAKTEFTKKYGSCLDAPDYYEHWSEREAYGFEQAKGYIVLGLYENNNTQSTEKD